MTVKSPSDDQKRDELLRRVLALKPMTQAELAEKLRRERAEKKASVAKGDPKAG
jgi:hypothetical protein